MHLNYRKANILRIGDHTIRPGVNHIPNDKWAEIEKNYGRKLTQLQDDGHLFIHPTEGEDAPTGASGAADDSSPLKSLDVGKARAMVRDTNDEKLLEQWAVSEDRKPVQDEITKQLEKLAKAANSK